MGDESKSIGLSHLFRNTAGQFAVEEVLKFFAGLAAVLLIGAFFFTSWIPLDKGSYVMIVEGALWGYAFAQGTIGNITKQ
jgi:hypothetical protein